MSAPAARAPLQTCMPPGPLPQHCTLHLPLPRRAPPPSTAAGTNFAIRASALAQVGWFPDYTVTEDYALGMELKMAGCRGADARAR